MRALLASLALILSLGAAEAANYVDIDASNAVTNTVIWDGSTTYPLQPGHQLILGTACIGQVWNGSAFTGSCLIAISVPSPTYVTTDALAAAGFITAAQAPVQSVNAKTGTVVVPNVCRQQSTATALPTTSPATLTWPLPLANNPSNCSFASPPACWSDISTTSTGSVFDYPLNTARSTTSVTYSYTSHASSVAVVVGGITIISVGGTSGAPPSGSTAVLTCMAPPA